MAESWRDDPGMSRARVYKRRFAYLPVNCTDGTRVWLKFYYKSFDYWSHGQSNKIFNDDDHYHVDLLGNISEEEYIVRKLAETL